MIPMISALSKRKLYGCQSNEIIAKCCESLRSLGNGNNGPKEVLRRVVIPHAQCDFWGNLPSWHDKKPIADEIATGKTASRLK